MAVKPKEAFLKNGIVLNYIKVINQSYISGDLRVKIVQSYSSSFYGSQLWDLSNKCIDRLRISWRKSIRKALNIPVGTHSVYLPLICERSPLNVQLELRVMKFFYERLK